MSDVPPAKQRVSVFSWRRSEEWKTAAYPSHEEQGLTLQLLPGHPWPLTMNRHQITSQVHVCGEAKATLAELPDPARGHYRRPFLNSCCGVNAPGLARAADVAQASRAQTVSRNGMPWLLYMEDTGSEMDIHMLQATGSDQASLTWVSPLPP
jgi:hypothetical protein